MFIQHYTIYISKILFNFSLFSVIDYVYSNLTMSKNYDKLPETKRPLLGDDDGSDSDSPNELNKTNNKSSSPEWSRLTFKQNDINRNILNCQVQCLPQSSNGFGYFFWCLRIFKVKQLTYILGLGLILLLVTFIQNGDSEDNETIKVRHYSHVPGMKGK